MILLSSINLFRADGLSVEQRRCLVSTTPIAMTADMLLSSSEEAQKFPVVVDNSN